MADQMPLRMPDGVMDYLEHGTTPVRQAEEECKAATGDPRSYERALERQATRDSTPRVMRSTVTGRSLMGMLADALGEED